VHGLGGLSRTRKKVIPRASPVTHSPLPNFEPAVPIFSSPPALIRKARPQLRQTSTIVAATVGTVATGFVGMPPRFCILNLINLKKIAYAFYFDYKRRNDPQFRKQLKKESKRQARAAKEEAEANTIRQRESIRKAVEEIKEEGFPTDVEEREAYFMQEVARGETLSVDGTLFH